MPELAVEIDKEKLRDFCRRKITESALFGSVTRPGEFRADSDVDVLVRFAPGAPWSPERWLDMRDELIAMFGRDGDVIERSGVDRMRNDLRRQAILDTAVLLDVA